MHVFPVPCVWPVSIISHFQLERPATAVEPLLMQSGFAAYLTSSANSAFAPELADRYQDMTQPLTSYYIDSSHNTYLVCVCLLSVLLPHLLPPVALWFSLVAVPFECFSDRSWLMLPTALPDVRAMIAGGRPAVVVLVC